MAGGARESLTVRNASVPDLLVVVRLGSATLTDHALDRSTRESHERFGVWGFSVLEVPGRDYRLLARLRPIVATRRLLHLAEGADLVAAGFRLVPTLDHPHWTVVLPRASPEQFALLRRIFQGPMPNPAWTGRP